MEFRARIASWLVPSIVFLVAGCGGNDSTEGSEAFFEILHGLKKAASSGTTYPALQKSRSLDGVEKAVIREFCNNVSHIRFNHEVHLAHDNRPYVVEKITRYAAYGRGNPFAAEVSAMVKQLQKVIDLGALDEQKLKRYEKACFV